MGSMGRIGSSRYAYAGLRLLRVAAKQNACVRPPPAKPVEYQGFDSPGGPFLKEREVETENRTASIVYDAESDRYTASMSNHDVEFASSCPCECSSLLIDFIDRYCARMLATGEWTSQQALAEARAYVAALQDASLAASMDIRVRKRGFDA